MADEKREESGYAKRFAQRRSHDNGSKTPWPAPLAYDYTRTYVPAPKQGVGDLRPLPCENMKLAAKFKRPHFTP